MKEEERWARGQDTSQPQNSQGLLHEFKVLQFCLTFNIQKCDFWTDKGVVVIFQQFEHLLMDELS